MGGSERGNSVSDGGTLREAKQSQISATLREAIRAQLIVNGLDVVSAEHGTAWFLQMISLLGKQFPKCPTCGQEDRRKVTE